MERKEIDYDYFCVLDFEATCNTKEQMNRGDMEIIEFPSVLLKQDTLEKIDEFQRFVKTRKFPVSQYCTDITGITQQQIDDEGLDFETVLEQHQEWLRSHNILEPKNVVFVTCGDWDLKTMLPRQCKQYNIPLPDVYKRWINIKKPFSFRMNAKMGGMAMMLKVLKLKLDGRHHSGIDDTRNIAKIVISLSKKGTILLPTGSIVDDRYVDTTEDAGYGNIGKPRNRGRGRGR